MSTRVILYTGETCTLCDDARALLEEIGEPFATRSDPRFRERVPVVVVDGRIVTEGRVSERALRRALRRPPP